MKISIRKLSALTGVSPATVSNALNHKKGVHPETAARVLAAAREYGYFDEKKIRDITLVIYKNHGKVVCDSPFFSIMIEGMESAARTAGYRMQICTLTRSSPDYDTILRELLENHTSALLLLATELPEEEFQKFETCDLPLVLVDARFENTRHSTVLIENTDSAYQAVTLLWERGHRKIGYLKSQERIRNFLNREKGYLDALQAKAITPDPAFIVSLPPQMDSAYQEMQRFLNHPHRLPTAYFADNDMIALGAMKALREHGCRVPEDVSVIGFDDLPYSRISDPPLTTIRVFNRELGAVAVQLLVHIIANEDKLPLKIQVCTELIERESVCPVSS